MKSKNKTNKSPLGAAGVFVVVGVLLLFISVVYNLQIMAFIGLGFTFWGAIFAMARKGNYVESSLLDGTAKSAYSTLDRMLNELKYAKGYYIPAYPEDAYLPDYLKNLKEPVVFISDESSGLPAVDELLAGKFLSAKSHGIFITAPGASIMAQMEKKVQLDFSKITLQELCGVLPRCSTEIFNLAKSLEMTILDNGVRLKASGILYQSLYRTDKSYMSVAVLGCPVVSAVACALAKTSGKTVVVQSQTLSPNYLGVEVLFNLVQG